MERHRCFGYRILSGLSGSVAGFLPLRKIPENSHHAGSILMSGKCKSHVLGHALSHHITHFIKGVDTGGITTFCFSDSLLSDTYHFSCFFLSPQYSIPEIIFNIRWPADLRMKI